MCSEKSLILTGQVSWSRAEKAQEVSTAIHGQRSLRDLRRTGVRVVRDGVNHRRRRGQWGG